MNHNSENKLSPKEFEKMNSEEKILKLSGGFIPPAGKAKNEVLALLLDKIEKETPTKTFRLKSYLQVAAAVIILLVGIKVMPSLLSAQQVKTKYAEQNEVILPDGTNVVLNADSRIKWDKRKFNDKRYLTLSGEAYFDVKKGEEFIIKTNSGTVEVLGTQLNVFSRNEEFWVSCISGKVKVSANKQQQIITPGEWVKLNNSTLEKSKLASIENTSMWKEGVFHFEETKLLAIFDELERQFNVSIRFEGDGERKATLDFSNKDLNEALDIVCIPMELSYEIKNRKVILSEKK